MADPVEQIFLQSQAGSADGAGFGEFFQRGQQIEQQNQKLDIERQQTRIAKATLGLRVREGEAKQLLRVAELEQDTLFTQNYAYWISQGADKKHIPQLMGMVNGTSANHKVVEQFFKRVNGIREVEANELQATASLRQAREFGAQTGQQISGASISQAGTTIRVGSSGQTDTATKKDLDNLLSARASGDTETASVYEKRLGLTSLSDSDQAVFDSKLRAIRQELTNLMAVLKASTLALPGENAKILKKASASAREQELELIREAYGLIDLNGAKPIVDDKDSDFNPLDPDNLGI